VFIQSVALGKRDTRQHLHEHKSETHQKTTSETHQKTTSSDPHKVPDIWGHMMVLNVYHLPIRKEEQDVCHDAASGERDEGESQRPGKAQGTHLHTQRRDGDCNPGQGTRVVDGGVEGF